MNRHDGKTGRFWVGGLHQGYPFPCLVSSLLLCVLSRPAISLRLFRTQACYIPPFHFLSSLLFPCLGAAWALVSVSVTVFIHSHGFLGYGGILGGWACRYHGPVERASVYIGGYDRIRLLVGG
ncbi:hypothetical protein K491DRAFT_97334 [Lophiostoma macrostomum CBS 122681]|uniref:Uncharacterized protein n=1 Tax=Lophiostoma macrostomum CBS 122681 TaxID=1314788 RepID=A0A6A6TLD3_9PLEO|nr:hypothetical protein K491DRAFT_97334 [Lophiostoma macrostomum CBS 122681]